MSRRGDHWVAQDNCLKEGRCFHARRMEMILNVSSNQASMIKDPQRKESYVEDMLEKASGEEESSLKCPVYGDGA